MEYILLARIDAESALAFIFSSAAYISLSFLIALAVRSVPNKLLLLGLLMALTSMVCGALMPGTGKLAFAPLIPPILLILIGTICLAIGFVVKLVKAGTPSQHQA